MVLVVFGCGCNGLQGWWVAGFMAICGGCCGEFMVVVNFFFQIIVVVGNGGGYGFTVGREGGYGLWVAIALLWAMEVTIGCEWQWRWLWLC